MILRVPLLFERSQRKCVEVVSSSKVALPSERTKPGSRLQNVVVMVFHMPSQFRNLFHSSGPRARGEAMTERDRSTSLRAGVQSHTITAEGGCVTRPRACGAMAGRHPRA